MGKWARRSFSLSLWLTGVSTVMSMAGNRWEIFVPQHILFSWTAIVYVWKQLEDTDSLLCCPHCNLVKYCSAECLEEVCKGHFLKAKPCLGMLEEDSFKLSRKCLRWARDA